MKYIAQSEGKNFEVEVLDDHTLRVDGVELNYDLRLGSRQVAAALDGAEHASLILDGRSYQMWMERVDSCIRVHIAGFDYDICVEDETRHRLRKLTAVDEQSLDFGQVTAPMPGLVVQILAEPGQEVKKGQGIIIVEAMKMENEIRSPVNGILREIRVDVGQTVEKGGILAVVSQS
jgi:biotin carboxyl carrier protein